MKCILSALVFIFLTIQVSAAGSKKARKPNSEQTIEVSNIASEYSVFSGDVKMKCQIVAKDRKADLSKVQVKNLVVDKAEYNEDDGGKSVTFWVKDDVVRNVNCSL